MRSITPFLWFDDNVEQAVAFYASVFPGVQVLDVHRNPDGSAFMAEFELGGRRYRGLNGGPHYRFNEAFSLFVECEDQAEVDRLWAALTGDGGEESMCGWCKDRFGLSWQIVPVQFMDLMASATPEQAGRVHAAMLQMRKLDVAALRAAAAG
jgi:predicted 3-demethylubiquinone-9 3-methyltransferase (glyoxalase superfamily)